MGGLIREDKGKWVTGFRRNLNYATSSTAVECRAIREGLKLALDRNSKGILVETDSFLSDKHVLNNIICDRRSMLSRLDSEVKHIYREGNSCADLLASLKFQQQSLVVLPTMPPCMGQAMYDDASGKKFLRRLILFGSIFCKLLLI
ncbi:hypothetical protein RHGRI_008980 [Rhododendron griersonianum]|uniref:RNase H type-1 domain-containing protein n=1 Tax=Rhododendron griersonianum TaxID=479676 RepID=A0AAV6L2N5_9ERIC|nr:hypothetical protein RHGRI_008980 [Rhododendron griersonianum]